MIYALGDYRPQTYAAAFIAPDANVIGNVYLGDQSSVWFGATLRGDNELISIGARSNIQENCVLHTDLGFPLTIGEDCTIGHKAMLHGCVIEDGVLIGMGATILNGATIGAGSLIGAGALVAENKVIPPGSLVIGSPGKVIRTLGTDDQQKLIGSARHYCENAARFAADLVQIDD